MAATAPASVRRILESTTGIDTPALVVDESIMHQNIAEMASFSRSIGVNLRPHIKTHKTPEIAKLQIAAGAVGIMCAKLGEAEVFAEAGIEDIAIGYQIVGEVKTRRLLALMERASIAVCLDSLDAAEALSEAMMREGRRVSVSIEVDSGHHRAGVPIRGQTVDFAIALSKLPGLKLTGIMTHEGHANAHPLETIRQAAIATGEAMVETAAMIRARGIDLQTVSVGSTPCAHYTPTVDGVTEMRPGTYVFRDTASFPYGIYGPDRCAARYVATVASRPAVDRAVLDAGSKTLSSDKSAGHPGHGYIVGHPEAIIDRLSEEHGVVELPNGSPWFAAGDRVEIIPNHVCPSVNLHDTMKIVRDGVIIDEWRIAARGKVR